MTPRQIAYLLGAFFAGVVGTGLTAAGTLTDRVTSSTAQTARVDSAVLRDIKSARLHAESTRVELDTRLAAFDLRIQTVESGVRVLVCDRFPQSFECLRDDTSTPRREKVRR